MGDKGEGGVQNFKKWVTSFMTAPNTLLSSRRLLCNNNDKNDVYYKNVSKIVKILHCGVRVDRDITWYWCLYVTLASCLTIIMAYS